MHPNSLLEVKVQLEQELIQARLVHRECIPIALSALPGAEPTLLVAGCCTICQAEKETGWLICHLGGFSGHTASPQQMLITNYDTLRRLVFARILDFLIACQEMEKENQAQLPDQGALGCFLCTQEATERETASLREGPRPVGQEFSFSGAPLTDCPLPITLTPGERREICN